MHSKNLKEIMSHNKQLFVFVATSDLKGNPNVASKFLLKSEDNFLYIIDFPVWKTWKNIKINPKICISFTNEETLKCYKIDGIVEIIEKGQVHKNITKEINKEIIKVISHRIAEELRSEKKHIIPFSNVSKKFVLYKVKAKNVYAADYKHICSRP